MFMEVIAFLARPEDYRAIWHDGELTIESQTTDQDQERAAMPMGNETQQRPLAPAVGHDALAAA